MIIRMFSGQAELLKGHLSANMRAQKESAQRIANATNGGAFADALTGQADIEKEMANLADVQLQTDASARLLGKFYQRMRTAIRDKV